MNITIQFNGTKTIDEIYKHTLKTIEDMVFVACENAANIIDLKDKLQQILALVENIQFKQYQKQNEQAYSEYLSKRG